MRAILHRPRISTTGDFRRRSQVPNAQIGSLRACSMLVKTHLAASAARFCNKVHQKQCILLPKQIRQAAEEARGRCLAPHTTTCCRELRPDAESYHRLLKDAAAAGRVATNDDDEENPQCVVDGGAESTTRAAAC